MMYNLELLVLWIGLILLEYDMKILYIVPNIHYMVKKAYIFKKYVILVETCVKHFGKDDAMREIFDIWSETHKY